MFTQIRNRLRVIVETTDTPAGKTFDLFIQGMILMSVVGFCIETLPDLSQTSRRVLLILEVIAVTVFTVEYLLRLFVAVSKPRFVFSFYGMIDFIAIAPFYLAHGVDLRALRAVRFFRLFRLFKLLRYTIAVDRYVQAIKDIRDELVVFSFAALMVLFFASVGVYYFESPAQPEAFGSIFQCFWWAIVTLTTVGYGDAYPITVGGKIFTSIVLIVGLGLVAVPTGLFASALTKAREK